MLIFDDFLSERTAQKFAGACKRRFAKDAIVCQNQDESDAIDPFPFALRPPIVLVERDAAVELEDEIIQEVESFKGRYFGT